VQTDGLFFEQKKKKNLTELLFIKELVRQLVKMHREIERISMDQIHLQLKNLL